MANQNKDEDYMIHLVENISKLDVSARATANTLPREDILEFTKVLKNLTKDQLDKLHFNLFKLMNITSFYKLNKFSDEGK